MASASEIFERFSAWKNCKTLLKVTVIERDEPSREFVGHIDAVSEEDSFIGFCFDFKEYVNFEVPDAEFSLEQGRIVASRRDSEWLVFEEAVLE